MSWRRILLLSLVLVTALGGATWSFLQRSDAATEVVRRELQALFRPRAQIASTELDLAQGRLSVHGLRLDDPKRPGEALLAVADVHVDVAVASGAALVGLHAVTVDGFVLEFGPTLPTAEELLAPGSAAGKGTPHIPPIELRGGRVRATLRTGHAPVELDQVGLQVVPRQDAPWLSLRGSARLVELGAQLDLAGDVDPGSGAATVTATLRGAAVDAATIARVAGLLGLPPPAIAAGASVRSLRITATLPPTAAAGEPRFDLVAELADVHVRGGELPTIVTAATVEVQASSQDGGRATVRLQQRSDRGALDVTAHGTALLGEPQIDLRVHGTDILIDAEILKALRLFDTGRDVVEALQPTTGRADVELFLRNPQRRGGLAELELSLRDVAMSFQGFGQGDDRAGFPLPMERTSGRVRLRDDVVLLEDVHATIAERAGGGSVRMQGRIDSHQPAGEDASLDIRADAVAFSPDLRAALTTLLDDGGSLYDKFAPSGRTEVDVQIRPRSELPGGWSVDVRPAASSMQWAGFPYRLDDLRGNVQARADGVRFDLAGKHGTGTLTMRGFIPLGPETGESRGFVANVDLAAITIDDDLRTAVAVLAPDLEAPWRACAPTGQFSGQVKVWRPRLEDPLFHDARVDFLGVDLQLPAAPWRAVGLQGPMIVQGLGTSTRVDFDALRGDLVHGGDSPAKLAMLGNVVVGDQPTEELAFVVRDLQLDAQLGQTLEELGALGPGTWASLQPSGRVDLVCRHRRTTAEAEPLHLVVHLLDVRSEAPILLRPAEHMTGELQIAGGELRFDDVRAVLGGAQVTATAGRVRTRPAPDLRTEIAFTVDARGVPIDDGVANLFSGPLRRAVLQRQLLGRADVDSLRLQFAIPTRESSEPFTTTLAGQLRLYDLDMTLGEGPDGILVQGISGVATLAESSVSDRGGQLRGALRGVSMQLFGQPLEAIEASFVADAERITIGALAAGCHGGTLRSARPDAPGIHYLLPGAQAPEGRLQADLTFENVDVYRFLDHGGWQNPPYSGAASGSLTLERLDGNSVLGAVGQGTIKVERADLGVVPLFTAIYAQLPPADRPRFDGLDVTWRVKNRAAEFERFDVRSSILAARGKGKLGFDGYLDVEMSLDNLLGSSADPFVMPLISYLAQNIVTFHLHGYLRDLRAEKRWVTESAPSRRPVVPMPPTTPRPTAPDF